MIEITNDIVQVANQLANAYKTTLRNAGKVSSGALTNFETALEQDGRWFSVVFVLPDYWKYVENGRRAGAKFPPISAIINWIRVKPIIPRAVSGKVPNTKQLAFLIARSISVNGIKPTHALQSTLNSQIGKTLIDQLCDLLIEQIEKPIHEQQII